MGSEMVIRGRGGGCVFADFFFLGPQKQPDRQIGIVEVSALRGIAPVSFTYLTPPMNSIVYLSAAPGRFKRYTYHSIQK